MNKVNFEQRLLALHYVFPVPLNKLKTLLEVTPDLASIEDFSVKHLSFLLKLSYERATRFKRMYLRALSTPFSHAYKNHGITPIPFNHLDYPTMLHDLIDPPTVLYTKGKIDFLHSNKKVAIVGSRKATSYSENAMQLLVPPLINNDIVIVSGLAKGADTMAHQAAIRYGGKTIAVLGSGFFHIYPKENEPLSQQISTEHLLITEYPPYSTPKRWYFPMRNRIISGLSDGIVVTEAAEKSGTLSTMEHALEHGKEIFAVPGSITSELSIGPHILLNEGAKPVWNGYQIVEELIPPIIVKS